MMFVGLTKRLLPNRRPPAGPAFAVLALALIGAFGVGEAQSVNLVVGRVVGSDTTSIRNPDSDGKPNQSRIWYNAVRGPWDALSPRDSSNGGASASDHYIMTAVNGSRTFSDVELVDRDVARPDVVWREDMSQLFPAETVND